MIGSIVNNGSTTRAIIATIVTRPLRNAILLSAKTNLNTSTAGAGVYVLACTYWRVQTGVYILACTDWRVRTGVYRLACTYWRVQTGVYVLAYTDWRVRTGVYRLACTYWRVQTGVYVLACTDRRVRTGVYRLACTYWRVQTGGHDKGGLREKEKSTSADEEIFPCGEKGSVPQRKTNNRRRCRA